MTYREINSIGLSNLAFYLETHCSGAHFWRSVAIELAWTFDGSPDQTPNLEIPSYYTKSGNPLTYGFSEDEFDLITEE
jgi:hypothetical protein